MLAALWLFLSLAVAEPPQRPAAEAASVQGEDARGSAAAPGPRQSPPEGGEARRDPTLDGDVGREASVEDADDEDDEIVADDDERLSARERRRRSLRISKLRLQEACLDPEGTGRRSRRSRPVVTDIRGVLDDGRDPASSGPAVLHLGQEVDVVLASCAEAASLWTMRERADADLHLYIDGRELVDLPGELILDGEPRVRFRLHRTATNQQTWSALQGGLLDPVRELRVTVGLPGGERLQASRATAQVGRLSAGEWLLMIGACVGLLAMIGWLGKGDLFRDRGRQPTDGKAAFSLARVQMAWWTVHVVGGFLLVTGISGQVPAIPGSLLILMGLGSGTLVAASAIEETVGHKREVAPRTTGSFWKDIVYDGRGGDRGASLHRLQVVAWSFIVGVLFWQQVCTDYTLPDFDQTILGLMGLSAATYLGMKIPEQSRASAGKGLSVPSPAAPEPRQEPGDPEPPDEPEEDPAAVGLEDLVGEDAPSGPRPRMPARPEPAD